MTQDFDVVISGSGAVGLSLAIGLKQRGINAIAMIEPTPIKKTPSSPIDDARVIALSNGSLSFLQSQLLDEGIENFCPIQQIQVSDQGHLGLCTLTADEYEVSELGGVIRLNQLVSQLEERAQRCGITWYRPASIASVSQSQEYTCVTLHDDQQIRTKLLIVAEGSQSSTREMLGVSLARSSYSQEAVVANVMISNSHQQIAYERFTADGPVALLPLDDKVFSLVWTMNNEEVDEHLTCSDQQFLHKLQNHFGYRAGLFEAIGTRSKFPLSLIKPSRQVGHRWVLMGNAMHTVHPIAGQGLNLGLRDVEYFLALLDERKANDDLGQIELLLAFQHARKGDIKRTVMMTDGLVRAYSNNFLPMIIGRNIGLSLMHFVSEIKMPLAKQALGWWRE